MRGASDKISTDGVPCFTNECWERLGTTPSEKECTENTLVYIILVSPSVDGGREEGNDSVL